PEGSTLPFSYVPTFGFFFGLILGSLPILIKSQTDTKISPLRIILMVFGFGLILGISLLKEGTHTISSEATLIKDFGLFKIETFSSMRMIWLGIIGILTAVTMIIPGISGSALLLALGEYATILHYIDQRSLLPIAIIGLGAIFGLILTTIIISKLLEKQAGETFYFIIGLILASSGQIILQMTSASAPLSAWLLSVITTLTGVVLALQSERLNQKP
ncbi:MAG: undecaprenyl phosphate translocase family protein, partial [Brevinema sp.]